MIPVCNLDFFEDEQNWRNFDQDSDFCLMCAVESYDGLYAGMKSSDLGFSDLFSKLKSFLCYYFLDLRLCFLICIHGSFCI